MDTHTKQRRENGIPIDTAALRSLRRAKVWDPADLARESGLSVSSIRKYESGEKRPRPASLRKLLGALGCDPADLIAGDGK